MIQFINVTKEYRNGTVGLRDINVKIEDGEFAFLIGASGAGKSTFTKLMIREIAPTSGSILIDGKGIHRLKRREIPIFRRNMGFVFQNYRLLSDRTAFENVAFAMEALGYGRDEVKKKAMYALGQMGLANRAQHFPAELSGGEQQRVAIARAIVNNPKILVADEPTGNLDFETSREIMDILYEINNNGTTILMATHDRGIVEKSHHRILTLDNGRLVGDDNLLAGYAIGHSNVKRKNNVLLDVADQAKDSRRFHAATEEIGRVNSRLSIDDAVKMPKTATINANSQVLKPSAAQVKVEPKKAEQQILLAQNGKVKNEQKTQSVREMPKELLKQEKSQSDIDSKNARSEQIKAVLEKSSGLKRPDTMDEKNAPLVDEKSAETTENQPIVNQTKNSTSAKTNDDWERLILEAFK